MRRSVYAATWEQAHDELTRLKVDSLGGVRLPVTGQTVAEYLEYWLVEVAQHRVRPSTLASYRWLARSYVLPYFGPRKLARVRPMDLRAYRSRFVNVADPHVAASCFCRIQRDVGVSQCVSGSASTAAC